MDIAKYIGLFLLKNNFCYLHGLGNLEMKKKPASYDGDALHAPEYDVVLTPGGSIDDTLANYIATHEQTSISKAANALRDFSTVTRAELAAGKEVEIPGIGHFFEQSGVVKFKANPQLKHVPPPVPILRMSKRLEEAPDFRRETSEEIKDREGSGIAWNKIALIGLLLAVVAAGIVFGLRYYNSNHSETKKDTVTTVQTVPLPVAPILTDTAVARKDTAKVPSISPVAPANGYTIVLNTYPTRAAADKRASTLMKNGNKVEVISRDSVHNYVTLHLAGPQTDTARMLDSLRRFFNPKGVSILH